MKYVLIILLFPICAFAQSIPKNANTIMVKGVDFKEVCIALLNHGYFIEARDSGLMTIKTVPRSYNAVLKTESTYTIFIRIKDGQAYLSGTYAGSESNSMPVFNHAGGSGKTKNSLPGKAFMLINDFALTFSKPVEYSRQ